MKVIIETGDSGYLVLRAQELIAESRHCDQLSVESKSDAIKHTHDARADECLKNAIALIAMARFKRAGKD